MVQGWASSTIISKPYKRKSYYIKVTYCMRQNAKLSFRDDKNLGGASVVISWSPKNILQ